ncbi:MAG TPA: hypothetical protein VJH88_04885 [Candidatus Nanoarchaeia archaeon]|nr:hypothetical protein [Candidatus Nanoarchaeia archaeon]
MNQRRAFIAGAITLSASLAGYMAVEEWRAPYVTAQKCADERQQKLEELFTTLRPISDAVLRIEYDPGFKKAQAYLDDIAQNGATEEKRLLAQGTKTQLEQELSMQEGAAFSVVLPENLEYEKLRPSTVYVSDDFFDKSIVTNESDQIVVLVYAMMRARHNKKGLTLGDIVTQIDLERATGASMDYEMMKKAGDNSTYAKFPKEVADDDNLMEAMIEYAFLTAQMRFVKALEKTDPVNPLLRADIEAQREHYGNVLKSYNRQLQMAEQRGIEMKDPRPHFARKALNAYQLK